MADKERRKADKWPSQYRDLKGIGWEKIERLPATLDGKQPEPGWQELLTESEKRTLWGDR